MNETVTITRAEELIPEQIADRLIDGESPLRVWREYRGLSRAALSRNSGSARTLRKLADGLKIAVDDLWSP